MRRKLEKITSVGRRYARPRPQRGSVSHLAGSAGLTARPTVEQLERRQMLFALAVTANDINPNTGIGTVRAFFGYTIPYLNTSITIQPPQPDTVINETFADEPFGAVGSGQQFAGSGIRTLHNIFPPNDYSIHSQNDIQDDQTRWLRVKQDQVGEFFSFQFFGPADNPTGPIQARTVSLTITGDGAVDNTGLLTDNVTVELLKGTTGSTVTIASFTGAALRALFTPAAGAPLGVGTLTLTAPANQPGFNEIRITMNTPPAPGSDPAFRITNISYTVPKPRFLGLVSSHIFGTEVVLSGPVGATATFRDLYGRDMQRRIDLGAAQGGGLAPVDINDDGVPDFNDGIGSIRFTGTDSRTAMTMWGGLIEAATTAPPTSDFFDAQNGFAFTVADITGLYDAFQGAGFGFAYDVNNGQVRITGLPPGPGSVIVGSPWVRDNTSSATYNPGGAAPGAGNPVTSGFNNPAQGMFIDDASPISGIYIHGIVNGSSHFTNFVDRIYVGYLLGSITVDGDLGSMVVGTDAGQWAPDPGFTFTNPNLQLDAINKSGSQLVAGRTMGALEVAGRSLMDVMVIGDLNNPQARPARDSFNYYEKEFIYGINPAAAQGALAVVRATLTNNGYVARQPRDLFRSVDQGLVFGLDAFYRNNSFMTAEWIGSASAGVRIKGDLSGRDPIQGEDSNDVYAFAADGSQDITIEGTNDLTGTAPYFRIMDQDGRTLAAPPLFGSGQGTGRFQATQLRFRPKGPGVYYLVVTDPEGIIETGFGRTEYTIALTGMATTTLGVYRTGGGSGFTDINTGEGNTVVVLGGDVGSMRIGTGISDAAGAEISPTTSYNTVQLIDDSMSFQGGTFTFPGTLYNITAGSDIGNPGAIGGGSPINIQVAGDFGTLFTGLSQVVGGGPGEGDLNFFSLSVGGRIASIDVRGGIGMDQDNADPLAPLGPDEVNITTGTRGGPGDIGFIRVGFHVAGDSINIRTSPNSTVGALLVSQDAYLLNDPNPRSGIYEGLRGISIISGAGSDVRFVDAPRVDLRNSADVLTPLIGGQEARFVDDAGSEVIISVENAPEGTQVGSVRVLPINGSQGVAIGQVAVNLTGGVILHIHGNNPGGQGIVSIGHIVIAGADGTSGIEIDGGIEVDVYSITGAGLDHISNTTPGGDLVSVDVASLNTLELKGDLGRTQVPVWGPSLIGPQLGLAAGLVNAVGGALGMPLLPGISVDNDFVGTIFRPVNDDSLQAGSASLDDIGSPIDGQLNGLVVRGGGLTDLRVDGAVGDVILQDPAGALASVTANADHLTALGRFDGIVGNIFAANIGTVDIGDGLIGPGNGPMAEAGIVAVNDITEVITSRASGAVIGGVINAYNSIPDGLANPDITDGVGRVNISVGRLIDARIASEFLDGFWQSWNYADDNVKTGNIGKSSSPTRTCSGPRSPGSTWGRWSSAGPTGTSTRRRWG